MAIVDEKTALRALKRRDESALAWMIDRYAAYVGAIIYNIIGMTMTAADLEEVASDVFFVLWSNADKIQPGKVKAYLSGVARNKAREKMRTRGRELPLEEDVLQIWEPDLDHGLEAQEQAAYIRRAILAMEQQDREIFLRHYYYCQPLKQISLEMEINLSTVKTRLRRGREKLKDILREGGYEVGDKNIGYDESHTG